MRLTARLLLATGLTVARTAATDANIYITGPPSGISREALSPATTRLLLAQRLGLSQYFGLEDSDDETLRILNSFGGKQKTLLSNDEPWMGPQKSLIIVEGVEQQLQSKIQSLPFLLPDVAKEPQVLSALKPMSLFSHYLMSHTLPILFSWSTTWLGKLKIRGETGRNYAATALRMEPRSMEGL
ncbi:MAG: hypothetical protein Q9208_007610 [Pyrenodesmia sp. 3 TL-2023]